MVHCTQMVRCTVALVQAEWALRRLPFAHTAERLLRPLEPGAAPTDALRVALDVRAAMHSVCRRLPWKPTCLTKAIAAQKMLRHSHLPSALVLSVCPTDAKGIRAHAWLEAAGTVVTGRAEAEKYSPLFRFDNSPPAGAPGMAKEASSCLL